MLIVLSIAGAAALAVVAYSKVQARSPETASAALHAVRDLAAVVLVCVKAVEGVVDVLAGHPRLQPSPTSWGYTSPYERGYDDEEDR